MPSIPVRVFSQTIGSRYTSTEDTCRALVLFFSFTGRWLPPVFVSTCEAVSNRFASVRGLSTGQATVTAIAPLEEDLSGGGPKMACFFVDEIHPTFVSHTAPVSILLSSRNCRFHSSSGGSSSSSSKNGMRSSSPQLLFNVRTPLNNGHGSKLHEDTIWAGVECLAVFILDCGLFLPPTQASLGVQSQGVNGTEKGDRILVKVWRRRKRVLPLLSLSCRYCSSFVVVLVVALVPLLLVACHVFCFSILSPSCCHKYYSCSCICCLFFPSPLVVSYLSPLFIVFALVFHAPRSRFKR